MSISVSPSPARTKNLAAKLAEEILRSRPHRKHARVIALVGELGTGKTTFVQGFAKALGVKHRIVSPTFLIFRRYAIRDTRHTSLYHADLYRIHSPKELNILGFRKILSDSRNIVLIEWAEKIKKMLPKDAIWVEFKHGRKETERVIAY